MPAEDEVEVIVAFGDEDVLAGRLWAHRSRGRESATFSYDESYLARGGAYELDPRLSLVGGPHQPIDGQPIFGALSDCAPDRWGRRLIQRAERRRAEGEDRAARSIGDVDYLLGVRDDLRQGALRFRDPAAGIYLAEERQGVPGLLDQEGHEPGEDAEPTPLRPDPLACLRGVRSRPYGAPIAPTQLVASAPRS